MIRRKKLVASRLASLKGSLFVLHRPKPPLEGRWHGVSRDGEVAALHSCRVVLVPPKNN